VYKDKHKTPPLSREDKGRISLSMTFNKITEKQKEITLLLFRFRFLNRPQIQSLLNNKDHKNINAWLKDLTEKNYVNRIYEETDVKNHLPARYCLSANGIKYLRSIGRDNVLLKKLYQDKRRSESFIEKSTFIADIYLKLLAVGDLQNSSFKFYSQSDFPNDGKIRDLLPDFAYVYRADNKLQHFVGEVFRENMKTYQMLGRVKKYIEYFEDDENETNIIFVCPESRSLFEVEKYVRRVSRNSDGLSVIIYTTTKKQIEDTGMDIELFNKATEV
jgi:hypothetical protein